jgi:hypothetical protein
VEKFQQRREAGQRVGLQAVHPVKHEQVAVRGRGDERRGPPSGRPVLVRGADIFTVISDLLSTYFRLTSDLLPTYFRLTSDLRSTYFFIPAAAFEAAAALHGLAVGAEQKEELQPAAAAG